MPEAWFNNSLRLRKPEGSLGRTAQDGHLDSHTSPNYENMQGMTRGRIYTCGQWRGGRTVHAQRLV